ncbi:MAG: tetratricopeptide repeat protein [Gammaproteobacteria bacterium]|nr:tetratricopeptide repeat protein [Gammaproteobacteria bacterium]NNJ84396.1 tetratricopeptide repeat protein [Gammaproteobacteria bacterium]
MALAVAILGTACASHQVTEESGTVVSAGNNASLNDVSPTASPAADRAKKGFKKNVLYDLLVAELAGQRNQIPVATSNYLAAAIASRDAAIAKRATRIAVLAKDQKQGLQAAKLWMELDPNAMEAKQACATLLVRADRIDEAVPIIHVLINRLDLPPDQRFLVAAGLLSQGENKAAALAAMEQMIAQHVAEHSDDEPNALFALAHFLVRIEKEKRAIDLLERIIEMDGKDPTVRVYYAKVLHDRGQRTKALDILSDALDKGIDDEDIRTNLARFLIGEKQYKAARKQLELLIASDPENTEIRYTLALLLLQIGPQNKAQNHLQHLIGQENLTQKTYFNLGQLAESQKAESRENLQLAMDAYRKVAYGQHYLDAQLRIAALLARQENLQAARAHLHGILPENEADSIRLYQMDGLLLTDAGDLSEAISVYDAALENHPDDNDLLYARAMLAGRMGQVSILEQDLRELLSREPDHVDALNALGYTLADKTDRYQEALTMIRKALSLQPDSYYILDSMGWTLYRLGRHQESIGYLRRALAMKQDPEVAAHLGEVLWVTGDRAAARDVWNTAREKAPDDELLLEVMRRFGE